MPLFQDSRFGLRMLLKSRGVTAVAVLALALGIGANTAIFSLVDAVILRHLPYKDPARLIVLWESNLPKGLPELMVSPLNYSDFRAGNTVFEKLAAYEPQSFALTGPGEPERVRGALVSAELFRVLGAAPLRGRGFLPVEVEPGREKVAVVGYGLWQRRYGGASSLLGSVIALDGMNFTVVGIMPPGFEFPEHGTEVWTPLVFTERDRSQRGYHHLCVVGRLKANASLEQARTQMGAIAGRLAIQYPVTNRGWSVKLVPLREQQSGETRPALLVLFGAVGFVLLIACANVASLLLARNAAREKEIAIRTALGAGRSRLIRQLLSESVLLALAGGCLGLCIAPSLTGILISLSPPNVVVPQEVRIHWGVLAFTLAISVATGLIFGLIPALQGSRTDLNELLKEGGRSSTQGLSRHRLRSWLAVSEVALALVLLVGAGLMLRSFAALQLVDAGFEPDHVLTMRIELPDSKYSENRQKSAFYRDLLGRLPSTPGVQSAAATNCLPLVSDFVQMFRIEGRPEPGPGEAPTAGFRAVTPDYFRTMRIPLRRGRAFTGRDDAASPRVAVINETLARQHWPGYPREDPVGCRLRLALRSEENDWRTVVGVVADVRHRALDVPLSPELYVPYDQMPQSSTTLVVRTTGDPAGAAAAIRAEIRAVDKDQPAGDIRPMERVVAESVAPRRAVVVLLGAFSILALVLAAVGVYGVISFSVIQRTNEIGIRLALGAQRGDVVRMVVGQALVLALSGVAIGTVVALMVTRALSSLLFGITARDPGIFAAVALLLVAVTVLASYIPARKATKVDPSAAFRG